MYETDTQTNLSASITVELIGPSRYQQESVIISTEAARNMLKECQEHQHANDHGYEKGMELTTGVHFLTDDDNVNSGGGQQNNNNGGGTDPENYDKKKNELLEYLMRHDGTVVCKLCGEVLASRTHWYRHKYKLHVNNMVNPAPLFKCTHCNVFFKSRKGYMGHISTRHSDNMEQQEELNISIKEEIVETVELPKINNAITAPTTISAVPPTTTAATGTSSRKKEARSADWEEQRVKEEKLVADIIDRVRRECEAQGAAVTRRGYSRRSTVMMMNTT